MFYGEKMPKEQINVASVGPTTAVTRRTLFMNVMKAREAKAKAKNKKKQIHKKCKKSYKPQADTTQL